MKKLLLFASFVLIGTNNYGAIGQYAPVFLKKIGKPCNQTYYRRSEVEDTIYLIRFRMLATPLLVKLPGNDTSLVYGKEVTLESSVAGSVAGLSVTMVSASNPQKTGNVAIGDHIALIHTDPSTKQQQLHTAATRGKILRQCLWSNTIPYKTGDPIPPKAIWTLE